MLQLSQKIMEVVCIFATDNGEVIRFFYKDGVVPKNQIYKEVNGQ